jgi:hypothetical protein
VLLALVAASLPFITPRFLGLIALTKAKKFGLRLLELLLLYLLVGAVGLFLEQRAGQIAPQTWEFYAITAALFLTFAFPGFVYRYLLKHKD